MKRKILLLCLVISAITCLLSCSYEAKHKHTFSTTWDSDETNHWKNATCTHGVKSDFGAHIWTKETLVKDPSETENGLKEFTCSICNRKKTVPVDKLPAGATINFDIENENLEITSQTETTITLPVSAEPTITEENKEFICWNTTSDLDGDEYYTGDSITVTGTIKLYPQYGYWHTVVTANSTSRTNNEGTIKIDGISVSGKSKPDASQTEKRVFKYVLSDSAEIITLRQKSSEGTGKHYLKVSHTQNPNSSAVQYWKYYISELLEDGNYVSINNCQVLFEKEYRSSTTKYAQASQKISKFCCIE